MGKYEEQLKALGTASADWNIDEFPALEKRMTELKTAIAAIAENPGWTGVSADAARELFLKIRGDYEKHEAKLAKAKEAISTANTLRETAAAKKDSLPDAGVPDWVHAAALVGGSVLVPVVGIGTFAAEVVVQKVNEFMSAQREAAAFNTLYELKNALQAPRSQLEANRPPEPAVMKVEWPKSATPPDWQDEGVAWPGDHNGDGAWSTNPGGSGGGGGGGGGGKDYPDNWRWDPPIVSDPPYPPIVLPPEKPPTVSIDGDISSGVGGLGGGGLGVGLAGAGAASGLGAAKLASKGGGSGLFGGLGSGASAGAGGGAGASAGAGAAGRGASSSGMMGGGGGGGGQSSKDKRSSLGLMAPKLDDDEETGPRSAAAGAGGRD